MKRKTRRIITVLTALLCALWAVFPAAAQTQGKTADIALYAEQPSDKSKFYVENIFPGDSVTKSFRVRVSHSESVTVHLGAFFDTGSGGLSDALGVTVTGPDGTVIYDGALGQLTDTCCTLTGNSDDELAYTLTAYLDTSVGNEYMDQTLTAELRWWVSDVEAEHLSSGGRGYSRWWYDLKTQLASDAAAGQGSADASSLTATGDEFPLVPVAVIAVLSGTVLLFLLCRKREGDGNA